MLVFIWSDWYNLWFDKPIQYFVSQAVNLIDQCGVLNLMKVRKSLSTQADPHCIAIGRSSGVNL
jgi:hypothetical protein